MRNLDEAKRLPVKEIDNINLITSPGAEYSATGRAILEITALHPEDGFSLQTNAEASVENLVSYQEGVQLKWKRKKRSGQTIHLNTLSTNIAKSQENDCKQNLKVNFANSELLIKQEKHV